MRIAGWVGAAALLSALVIYFAESPDRLDGSEEPEATAPPVVAIDVQAPEQPPAPPPEESVDLKDSLADLAPESFQADQDLTNPGFGAAFGQGGDGPAVASAGGLGGDSGRMVQEAAADRSARVVYRGALDYPKEAKNRGITGYVVLKLRLASSGQLEEARVNESHPPGVFDQAALRAVRSWRYEPAWKSGRPQATWITQRIRFDLN